MQKQRKTVNATAIPVNAKPHEHAKITFVEFGQVFNTGNYSSERIALRAEVNDEDWRVVLNDLRRQVFWKSAQGAKLKKDAAELAAARPDDLSITLWNEAVQEEEETRPYQECRRYYKVR